MVRLAFVLHLRPVGLCLEDSVGVKLSRYRDLSCDATHGNGFCFPHTSIWTGAYTQADRKSAEDATGDPLWQGVLAEGHQLAGGLRQQQQQQVVAANFSLQEQKCSTRVSSSNAVVYSGCRAFIGKVLDTRQMDKPLKEQTKSLLRQGGRMPIDAPMTCHCCMAMFPHAHTLLSSPGFASTG